MVKTAKTGAFDAEHEGGSGGGFCTVGDCRKEVGVVGGDEDGDYEGAEDVENHETKDEFS